MTALSNEEPALVLRTWRAGDEQAILEAFNATFKTRRTLAHWQWKYLNNPYGATWIAAAWDKQQVVAQYAGYPVPLYFEDKVQLTCQAADAFTVPKYRKVGHGPTSLMSRCFHFYESQFCAGNIPFGYGFNVNKIQKLGTAFWQHKVPAAVYQHKLSAEGVAHSRQFSTWWLGLKGYKVRRTAVAGEWATQLFEQVKDQYGWLLVRDQTYLDWRYAQHPDFKHEFFVVYRGSQVLGWIVGRRQGTQWLWGDGLFAPETAGLALPLVLKTLLSTYPELTEIDSWFAEVPAWWNQLLAQHGFVKQRQHQQLDLVVRFYLSTLAPEALAQNFYFTWGDSDLY